MSNEAYAWLDYYILRNEDGGNKMAYNAKNIEVTKGLPPGITSKGVIKTLVDGKVEEFVHEKAKDKWKLKQPAINIEVEVIYNDKTYMVSKMFPYNDIDGRTTFGEKSDLGKYNKYYKKVPEMGDQVNLITNSDGYWRILLE